MSKFLVTGGAGFIGSHLVDRMISEGHDVIILDNLVTGSEKNLEHISKNPKLTLVYHDVSTDWHDHGKVDGVFHFASPASPVDFDKLSIDIMKVGSLGTFHALEYAKKYGAWFIMASTSEVYGDPLVHPQHEGYLGNVNCIGPRSVYDESKRFSESLTMAYHRKKYVQTSIVRIFNTYGPRMRKKDGRVVTNFIIQALLGEPLTVYGDGKQTRSFCYVDDLVEGIYSFWKYKPENPVNLGNPTEMSMLKTAQQIIDITKSKSEIVFKPLPEDDPKQRCPDITRAKKLLKWEPKVSFKDGVSKTVEYFRSL